MIKTILRTGPLPDMMDARFAPSQLYAQARGRAQAYATVAKLLVDLDLNLSRQFHARATVATYNATCLYLIGRQIDADHVEALAENIDRVHAQAIAENKQRKAAPASQSIAQRLEAMKWRQSGNYIRNQSGWTMCHLSVHAEPSGARLIVNAPALAFLCGAMFAALKEAHEETIDSEMHDSWNCAVCELLEAAEQLRQQL